MTRLAMRPGEPSTPRVERVGAVWHLRAMEPARQLLRERDKTTQAGFTAEKIPRAGLRHRPILISDGPTHDEQRRDVARFFAPKTIERYEPLMREVAERRLADAGAEIVLDELALHYAVEVTARIVGLTHDTGGGPAAAERAIRGMSKRLVSFFRQPPFDLGKPDLGRTPRQWMQAAANGLGPLVAFYLRDVRPAVRQRRRSPAGDVLSHLIGRGYSEADLLVEALTYGTAGMVTTREFIVMAAWHLLRDDALRARYLAAEREQRHRLLQEISRLEPPVGHLYRRCTADIEITDGDMRFTLERGEVVDVAVRAVNADGAAVGRCPLSLDPERQMSQGVGASGLSFGDGAHSCPGQPLAIWETDVLLTLLLADGARLVGEPTVTWDDMIAGYVLRGAVVRKHLQANQPADDAHAGT